MKYNAIMKLNKQKAITKQLSNQTSGCKLRYPTKLQNKLETWIMNLNHLKRYLTNHEQNTVYIALCLDFNVSIFLWRNNKIQPKRLGQK